MAFKKNRSVKVYERCGYNYRPTPTIMLKGQWLKELGFDAGTYISVSCENGKLVIAICAARRPLVRLPAATRRSPTATFIKVFR